MTTAVIEQDADGGFFIVIPDDIAEELDFQPGDQAVWEIDAPAGDHRAPSVTIRKL